MSRLSWTLCGLAFAATAGVAAAQSDGEGTTSAPADSTALGPVYDVPAVFVTATRSPIQPFEAPVPVSVIDRLTIEELSPNTVSDLFRSVPGLEVNGVGVNQRRPGIRGQRGQRILLLEDGLRLNNSRRQSDFGEIPGLVDVSTVERVEIVRGPASVLYGSDAIGGVVNMITTPPPVDRIEGNLSYRYDDATEQHKGSGRIAGRYKKFGFSLSGAVRNAEAYEAPSGSFGDITLESSALVNDTGVEDESADLRLYYDLNDRHQISGRFQLYRADTTGFGYVRPEEYAPDLPLIEITYPYQDFDKFSAGYIGTGLESFAADRVSVDTYYQTNERRFDLEVFTLFGPTAPPGAGVLVETENFTDLRSTGVRVEAQKQLDMNHRLTYGVDFHRDDAEGTDFSRSTLFGFGPPMVEESTLPLVPESSLQNIGVFAQDDVSIGEDLNVIVGARFQSVTAETKETEGIDDPLVDTSDQTVVGAVNASYRLSRDARLVASVGRAFRSPNLVERFFNGATPEGNGFQVRNPDLDPETSLSVDLGARLRHGRFKGEVFVFRNEISEGVRVAATGDTINGMPAFQNINVEKLRYTGLELSAGVELPHGFEILGNMSLLDSEDVEEPELPVGDFADTRFNGWLRYELPQRRAYAEYQIRYTGEREDAAELGSGPIGDTLPAFTTHSIHLGAEVLRTGRFTQHLGLRIENLTDELYAEFTNASFFRPEPGRHAVLTWTTSF